MFFGLSYTSLFAIAGAALVYYQGTELAGGFITMDNRLMMSVVAGVLLYMMRTGDMVMGAMM